MKKLLESALKDAFFCVILHAVKIIIYQILDYYVWNCRIHRNERSVPYFD